MRENRCKHSQPYSRQWFLRYDTRSTSIKRKNIYRYIYWIKKKLNISMPRDIPSRKYKDNPLNGIKYNNSYFWWETSIQNIPEYKKNSCNLMKRQNTQLNRSNILNRYSEKYKWPICIWEDPQHQHVKPQHLSGKCKSKLMRYNFAPNKMAMIKK